MNKYQRSKLESFNLIVFEADNYAGSIAVVPKFAAAIAELKGVCTQIKNELVQQEKDITGVTEDKHQILNELIDMLMILSGALQSYALEKKNNTLYESVKFSESFIEKSVHTDISSISSLLVEEMDKLTQEELTAEGISTEDVAEIKKLDLDFKEMLQAPRQAIIDRTGHTENMRNLLEKAAEIKNNVLDNLVIQFKRKDPEFYFKYNAAANVIIRHGGSKNSNGETDSKETNTEDVKE